MQVAKRSQEALHLLRAAWRDYERDYARYFAAAIVYYALISLVPMLALLLATVGLLLRSSHLAAEIEQRFLSSVQLSLGEQLRDTVEQSLHWLAAKSPLATTIGLIGLATTASALILHLRMSFRAIWKHRPPMGAETLRAAVWATVLEKLIAFLIVLAGGTLLLAASAVIAILQWPSISQWRALATTPARLVAVAGTLLMTFCIFVLLLKILPPVRLALRDTWFASVLCAAAWLVGSELLELYGTYFRNNVGAYSALGAVLVLMIWMNVMSQLLFFGAELCKAVQVAHGTRSGHQ